MERQVASQSARKVNPPVAGITIVRMKHRFFEENSSRVASNIAAGMAQPWKTPQIARNHRNRFPNHSPIVTEEATCSIVLRRRSLRCVQNCSSIHAENRRRATGTSGPLSAPMYMSITRDEWSTDCPCLHGRQNSRPALHRKQ